MEQAVTSRLTPDMLVRYRETTTRWYFALVRTAKPDKIVIKLFSGERKEVSPETVQPFAEFMAERTKSLSLDRTDLCQRFFAQDLLRLREDKLKLMQATLRKHGYSFAPEEWPSPHTRIAIQRDHSVVLGNGRPADRELAALLPHWLDPQKMPPGSRDPLGLQAHAEHIANKLLPGLTVTTTRIGYYGFLCWALRLVNEREPQGGISRREMLNRLERALVLCEFVHHRAEDEHCRLIGQRSRTQVLQSVDGDRYRVPGRILKNQNTAGALRLYATSLVKLGFVDEAPDLAAAGRLPWELTSLGHALAKAFDRRVPGGFTEFALGDGSKTKESIRSWGQTLCFSRLHELKSYRDVFLSGFLCGKPESAETRFSTVRRLFERQLLTGAYGTRAAARRQDAVTEEDVDLAAELDGPEGLGNYETLIHFYEERPTGENADFQEAAVYEFIGLGLATFFHHAVQRLHDAGQLPISTLLAELAKDRSYSKIWERPRREAVRRVRSVRDVVEDLFEAEEDPARQAVLGAELLLALVRSTPYAAVRTRLAESPVLELFEEYFQTTPDTALSVTYPQLLSALVERHAAVSAGKNRQRWCYLDGDMLRRDDLQPMGLALHALRFPQLHALCADLELQEADLAHVD